jgi:hypothetical protein
MAKLASNEKQQPSAFEYDPGMGYAAIRKVLRQKNDPYLQPAALAAQEDARQRLPIKYARKAAAAIGNHAPNHNVLTLAHALSYAERGLHVIDSHALDKRGKGTGPGGQSKVPRGARWQERATNDPAEVLNFWTGNGTYPTDKNGEEYPFARVSAPRNVSIAFPEGCGLFVLDIDGEEGRKALEALEAEYGALPHTWESITGSGGLHLIFRAEGLDIRNTASSIAPGVDIRGKNGQIIAPPSVHPSGQFYRWADGCAPYECEVANAPEWLRKLAYEATKGRGEDKPKSKAKKRNSGGKRAPGAKSNSGARGFDGHLAEIGDGEGLRGFDAPIYAAACAYFARQGADADAEPLVETLRETILVAPCKDDRAERRYATADYLDTRVEQAREFIAEDEDAPFNITAPLGENLEEALASLRRGFRYVNIGGEGRFIRHLVPGEPPKLEVWSTTALSNWYTNQKITVTVYDEDGEEAGEKKINPVPEFFNQARRWAGTAFAPPPVILDNGMYNLFRGFTVESEPGDCTMLKDFLRDIICDGDEEDFKWLWHWMAHLVQRPGEKPKTAVVIWGEGGIGKGHFGRILRALVHPYGTTLGDSDSVIGRWAGEIHALNLVCVSEEAVFSGDRKIANALKHKIDHEKVRVEVKHIQPIELNSYTRYVFDSNHPDAVYIEGNGSERRFFVRRVSAARKGDTDYFAQLREEIDGDSIKALFHELMTYRPADAGMEWRDVFMAPETHDRKRMEHETMRPVYRAFARMIEDGEFQYQDGLEKYRFDLEEGQTWIPKRMLQEFVARHGDNRQAAETDPARVFERLYGRPLASRRARAKCYYRRANEHDAGEWEGKELNVQCYDLRVEPLMLPLPDKV